MTRNSVGPRLRRVVGAAWIAASIALAPAAALAQSGGLAGSLVHLFTSTSTPDGNQAVAGTLYGAAVRFVVQNADGNPSTIGAADRIRFFSIARGASQLQFASPAGATREQFRQWATDNADALMNLLFPMSISQSVSGRDSAHNQAQQFLLNTALQLDYAREAARTDRTSSGGLFEVETLTGDARSAFAIQGLYGFGSNVSVIGRYTHQREGQSLGGGNPLTHSVSIGADVHPAVAIGQSGVRVGLNGRGGLIFSSTSGVTFGSMDYGGGAWTSVVKDFSRVRIGAGSILEATKSYVPTSFAGDMTFLADAINQRPLLFDFTYGGIAGLALSSRVSLNGKYLQTAPIHTDGIDRTSTTLVMTGVSYLVKGVTPIDVGYKYSDGGGIRGHSIFLQGHFGF